VIAALSSRRLGANAYAACATSFFRLRTRLFFTWIPALNDILILSSRSQVSALDLLSALPDPFSEHFRSTAE
jgi:hypothetical protein